MRLDRLAGLAAAVVLLGLTACSDSPEAPTPLPVPTGPAGGVAGIWTVNSTYDATQCSEGITAVDYVTSISQSGNDLTVTVDGEPSTGTLNGTDGTWSGSYLDTGGTTNEMSAVVFSNSNNNMAGGSTWTWSDGATSCSGTSTLTGSK